MKKIAAFVLAALVSVGASAIRPIPKAFTVKQSDGTTLSVYKKGNDHLAFYTTLDGKVLVRNSNGDLCYAAGENGVLTPTTQLAHNTAERSAAEIAFVESHALTPTHATAQKQEKTTRIRKATTSSTTDGLGKYGTPSKGAVKSIGSYTIPVIMVQFSDKSFKSTTTIEKMNRYYNEEGYADEDNCVGSVRDYFISQSRGMFKPTFEIVGIVTLSSGYKTYGANDSQGYDKGWTNYKFLKDCVAAATAQGVDFSKYVSGDGVPLVALLYAGPGEATDYTGNAENYLWPAEDDCDIDIDGVHFNSVFMGNELDTSVKTAGTLMGMGVFVHEFGHALGLPDLYVTDYSYENDDPYGYWSVMDGGAYVKDSNAPMGYTAYERSFMGWLNLPELGTTAQKVTLNDIADENGTNAVIIRHSSTETFILENRQPGTWYPSAYGSGLMLSRIAYSAAQWEANTLNNTQSKKRAYMLTANNVKLSYGTNVSQQNLYGNSVSDITALPTYSGTTKKDAPIYEITKNGSDVTFYWLSKNLSPYKEGDSFDNGGLTYQYKGDAEVWVEPKAEGYYAGSIQIPATFDKDDVTYTVVGIDSLAFASCPELTAVGIPATVTTIAADAFRTSSAMTTISVDEGNAAYQSVDGVLFNKSKLLDGTAASTRRAAASDKTLDATFNFADNTWALPVSTTSNTSLGNITEPLSVDDVTMTATNGNTATRLWQSGSTTDLRVYKDGGSLTFSVPEGQTITNIDFTFSSFAMTASTGTLETGTWTGDAQSVTFSATATNKIKKAVVTYTSGKPAEVTLLHYPSAHGAAYTLPTVVSHIADYAFEGAAVETLVLSDSLQTLGALSLSTSSLTSLTAKNATPATAKSDPFSAINKATCTLIVPEGSETAYKAADYWKDFFNQTGISHATTSDTSNGNALYDLSGRRVTRAGKGVYILNGQKIIVR